MVRCGASIFGRDCKLHKIFARCLTVPVPVDVDVDVDPVVRLLILTAR